MVAGDGVSEAVEEVTIDRIETLARMVAIPRILLKTTLNMGLIGGVQPNRTTMANTEVMRASMGTNEPTITHTWNNRDDGWRYHGKN